MQCKTLKIEHPYHGLVTIDVSTGYREALDEAVTLEHPCEDQGCDIHVAQANGFVVAAAYHLMSGTEAEVTSTVIEFFQNGCGKQHEQADVGTNLYDNVDWDGWLAHHKQYGRLCDCGSYTYAEVHYEPEVCANCHAKLPPPPAEIEARAKLQERLGLDPAHEWPPFAWPGGYPIAYITDDADTVCAKCMNDDDNPIHFAGQGDGWRVDAFMVLEGDEGDDEVQCAHCNDKIGGES